GYLSGIARAQCKDKEIHRKNIYSDGKQFTGKLFLNIFLILGRAFFMLSGKSSVGTRIIAILMTEFDPNGKTIFVRTIFDAIMNDDKFAYVMPLSINNFLGLTTIVKPIKRIAIPRYSENCKLS